MIQNTLKMSGILNMVRNLNLPCKRYLRNNSFKLPSEVIIPLNKEMIVCWHPERKFPYECSLPLPEEKEMPSISALCIGRKEILDVFKQKRQEVVIQELSKITYTTKHRWYPKKRIYRSRRIEPDRPYL